MKIKTDMYFHSDKSTNICDFEDICEENGVKPTKDAIDNSAYAGFEVAVDVEWDLETGDCVVLGTCSE